MPEVALPQTPGLSRLADGPTAMAICNALVAALKRRCGKGPTKLKSYGLDQDLVVIVGTDALTAVEKSLVEAGRGDLVQEARRALADEVTDDCRAAIEEATARRMAGLLIQVDPTSDRLFAVLRLEPVSG